MIDSNRLTIIVPDCSIYTDTEYGLDIDFSICGIPENIHCLQWKDGQGEIEYVDPWPNQEIMELPKWAIDCYHQFLKAKTHE